jgi:molybdenum cofactor synthesis domain-containing protein
MKPMHALLPVEEAKAIILGAVRPIERTEPVPLDAAGGRVLAAPLTASQDVPPFPRAIVDGYAVRAQETFAAGQFRPAAFQLAEVVHAGEEARAALVPGRCVQVATGAPVPEGADAVVMFEDTEAEGDRVQVFKPAHPGQNIAPRGQDIAAGASILAAGTLLTPSKVGVLAALGVREVAVYARPRVAVVPSGNEVVAVGEPLAPGRIYDVNSHTLAALVREHGGHPTLFPIMKDTVQSVLDTLRDARGSDLVVLSGGSSVGDRDVMVEALTRLGEVKFHGIAVRPGKPTLCAVVEGTPVLGMPGNPTSCLTNGYGLLVPALRVLARLPRVDRPPLTLPLARRVTSPLGRHEYLPVKVAEGHAVPVFKGSGAITSMADAEGYIEIPWNVEFLERGHPVDVRFF